MTDYSIPGALSKSFDTDKNHRAHTIFTEYDRYRNNFFKDLHSTINDTDYLVSIANVVDANKYLRQTPPHKVKNCPKVELTPDLKEMFKTSNPRDERNARYREKNPSFRLPDTRKYTFRMALAKKGNNTSKKVNRYPLYHPKGVKSKSEKYLYLYDDENSNSNSNLYDMTGYSPKNYSYQNTAHQNTDNTSYENSIQSDDGLEDTSGNKMHFYQFSSQNNEAENKEIINENQNHLKLEEEETPDNSPIVHDSSENAILQAADEILNSLSKGSEINDAELQPKAELDEVFEEEEEEITDDEQYSIQKRVTFGVNSNEQNNYDLLDTRPANCGNSPDGSADFVMSISAPNFLNYCSNKYGFIISEFSSVPHEEFELMGKNGFNWVYIKDLPQYSSLQSFIPAFHQAQLKIFIDYDETVDQIFADGIIFKQKVAEKDRIRYSNKVLISPIESEYADYFYDERPINFLRNQDPVSFMKCIQEGGIEKQRKIIRFVSTDGLSFNERSEVTAAAMLLMLPGMRIINIDDIQILERLRPLIEQTVIWNGVFEYVNFTSNGNMCSWKYSRGIHHLLIAANFDIPQTTGHIICNDCPDVRDGEKVKFIDILTETKYFRELIEVQTKGLCVILYEYEAQIFEY